MSKTNNNILETEPTNALYGKFRPLESKNGALIVDVDLSGDTDGLASEATLNSLNLKVSKGADQTLITAQQNVIYGRESGGGLRANEINTDGELKIFNNESDIANDPDNITTALKVQNLCVNNDNTSNLITTRCSSRGITTLGTFNNTPPTLTDGNHEELQLDTDGNLKTHDSILGKNFIHNTDPSEVIGVGATVERPFVVVGGCNDVEGAGLTQINPLQVQNNGVLMANITDGVDSKASDNPSHSLTTTLQGRTTITDRTTAIFLKSEATGELNVKNPDIITQAGTSTIGESTEAPIFYNGLHDGVNNLMRVSVCNEYGEQYVDDIRGRYGVATSTNLNTVLTGTVKEQKQVLIAGADVPSNPTQLNNITVDNDGLLKIGDTRSGELTDDHPDTDKRQEVYVSARVKADGSLLVKNLASSTFLPIRSSFVNYTTSINPISNTTIWNNNNVANDVGNHFRWWNMEHNYNYANIFFNIHQGTNQPSIAPFITGSYPLYDKNNVPLIDPTTGAQLTNICILQILSSDSAIDISGLSYHDLQGRVNYSQQIILFEDLLNTDGISNNFVGSYHGYIPHQYFIFVLRCASSSVGTVPTQNIRIGRTSRA